MKLSICSISFYFLKFFKFPTQILYIWKFFLHLINFNFFKVSTLAFFKKNSLHLNFFFLSFHSYLQRNIPSTAHISNFFWEGFLKNFEFPLLFFFKKIPQLIWSWVYTLLQLYFPSTSHFKFLLVSTRYFTSNNMKLTVCSTSLIPQRLKRKNKSNYLSLHISNVHL